MPHDFVRAMLLVILLCGLVGSGIVLWYPATPTMIGMAFVIGLVCTMGIASMVRLSKN